MKLITLESLDRDARRELRGALKEARGDAQVLVIAGEAGAWDHSREAGDARDAQREFHSIALSVLAHPAPVIAALAGSVSGFGLALAAAADARLAADGTKLRVSEPGVALESGAYRLLVNLLGRARADELVYSGRELTVEEASRIGLVSGPLMSMADAEQLAETLSTPGAAAFKRAATSALVPQLTEQMEYDAWLALTAAGESL